MAGHFGNQVVGAPIGCDAIARILEEGGAWEKILVHIDRYGNLDTATLPVAFHEGRREGRITTGDLVMFAAIGAGWQFGAAIARV